jgi:hypothetical protein
MRACRFIIFALASNVQRGTNSPACCVYGSRIHTVYQYAPFIGARSACSTARQGSPCTDEVLHCPQSAMCSSGRDYVAFDGRGRRSRCDARNGCRPSFCLVHLPPRRPFRGAIGPVQTRRTTIAAIEVACNMVGVATRCRARDDAAVHAMGRSSLFDARRSPEIVMVTVIEDATRGTPSTWKSAGTPPPADRPAAEGGDPRNVIDGEVAVGPRVGRCGRSPPRLGCLSERRAEILLLSPALTEYDAMARTRHLNHQGHCSDPPHVERRRRGLDIYHRHRRLRPCASRRNDA